MSIQQYTIVFCFRLDLFCFHLSTHCLQNINILHINCFTFFRISLFFHRINCFLTSVSVFIPSQFFLIAPKKSPFCLLVTLHDACISVCAYRCACVHDCCCSCCCFHLRKNPRGWSLGTQQVFLLLYFSLKKKLYLYDCLAFRYKSRMSVCVSVFVLFLYFVLLQCRVVRLNIVLFLSQSVGMWLSAGVVFFCSNTFVSVLEKAFGLEGLKISGAV